jgi:hypothetical protein
MTAAGDQPFVPTRARPWPDYDEIQGRLFDQGIYWCAQAKDHSQHRPDDYPGWEHHRTECRSYGGLFWDARIDATGPLAELEVYAARPFDFGRASEQRQQWGGGSSTRLFISAVPDGQPEQQPFRVSLPIEHARRLARHLTHLADVVDGYTQPWGPTVAH